MKIVSLIKKRKKRLIIGLIAVVLSGFFFYNFGILKYIELKREKKELLEKIDKTDQEHKALRANIDSLKTSDAKIERVAREKYSLRRADEKVFKVEEK